MIDNLETSATLDTRNRPKTKKLVPNLETYVTLDTRHRQKKLVLNLETYVTLDTRHRPKTKCGSQSIDICNSGHMTQTEEKKWFPI